MDSTLVLDGDTNTESQRLADGDPTTSKTFASSKCSDSSHGLGKIDTENS